MVLARALAADPHVLLCDELTSALDEHTSEHVLAMLRDRQQETGISIIWATHDLALARSFSDATLDLGPEGSGAGAHTAHDPTGPDHRDEAGLRDTAIRGRPPG